jgi:uncharacterized protein
MARDAGSQGVDAPRGFANMDRARQREIARIGGANVPNEKRSFAQNRELAAAAGRKGGRSVAPHARSFSQDRNLAAEAGRKGGRAAQRHRRQNAALDATDSGRDPAQ